LRRKNATDGDSTHKLMFILTLFLELLQLTVDHAIILQKF